MTNTERRKEERLDLEVPAKVTMMDPGGLQRSYEIITKDINSCGAFFLTDYPLAVVTNVKMDILLSFLKSSNMKREKKAQIDISGWVVRTQNDGMAVCFDNEYSISPYKG